MAYEGDKALLIGATAAAGVSAGFLWEYPAARIIVVMLSAFISDPEAMAAAAADWRSPGKGEEEVDLDALKNHIVQMRDSYKDKWKGAAFSTFSSVVDTFVDGVDQLKRNHDAAGDSLDQTARMYHIAAQICVSVAGVLSILAGLQALCLYPPIKGAVMAATHSVLRSLVTSMKGLLNKQTRAVFMIVGVVGLVNWQSSQTGSLFPNTTALPQQPADYSGGYLKYTDEAGLQQDLKVPQIPGLG
ncbi:WXG100 family type VII secretion target [Microtetraspora malaysiensis]|uniref:WXG100 family type VII secretion target n=1 Tax=Microtetraspora malaysiensis TaxID=161358 RepID=UPI003D93A91C